MGKTNWTVMGFILVVATITPCGARESTAGSYQRLRENGDAAGAAVRIQRAFSGDEVRAQCEALCRASAFDGAPEFLAKVVEALGDRDEDAVVLAASELMFTCADMARRAREFDACFPDALAAKALPLLNHEAIFVRGMASWALATRVHRMNQTQWGYDDDVLPRRSGENPSWFAPWREDFSRNALEYDYVRQAVALRIHRSPADLVADAEAVTRRARGLLGYLLAQDDARKRRDARASFAELVDLVRDMRERVEAGDLSLYEAQRRWIAARRAARDLVMLSPELRVGGVVFATWFDLHVPNNINTGAMPQRQKPGGDICVKRGLEPYADINPLLKGRLGPGSVRGLDLHWDGDRVLFSYSRQPFQKVPYGFLSHPPNLHEMDIDGSNLSQLTDDPFYTDQEPCYLPDGGIAFVSDRSCLGNQCASGIGQDKRVVNLYRLDRDGRVTALTNNKDFDRFPHVLANGQLVFTHWEYQERNFYDQHTVWTCRPDGTYADAFYKQHFSRPMSIRYVRQVPDGVLVTATAQGHHDFEMGPLLLIDPSMGVNNRDAMRLMTPYAIEGEGGLGRPRPKACVEGGVPDLGGLYQHPWPLSEKGCLTSFAYGRSRDHNAGFGLYYVDVWGNQELIHREPVLSSVFPIPLGTRTRPPALPSMVEERADEATCFLSDVYADLPGVPRGAVRHIRISQRLPFPSPNQNAAEGSPISHGTNHHKWFPGNGTYRHFAHWTWAPTRVIGTVPVEADGSAYFHAPANVPIFFQALDENYMELRRMRSNVALQRGEKRGCVGCHETKAVSTLPAGLQYMAEALDRQPDRPTAPPWGDATILNYERDIQPIFDRHCVRCHGQKEPAGGLELTSRRISGFMQSYRSIFGLKPSDLTPIRNPEVHQTLNPESDPSTILGGRPADEVIEKMQENQFPGMLVSISDRMSGAEVTRPLQFGSHRSKLITQLLTDAQHRRDVHVSPIEWRKLVVWVDSNAVYHSRLIDKSLYRSEGVLKEVEMLLRSPWDPAADGALFCGALAPDSPRRP